MMTYIIGCFVWLLIALVIFKALPESWREWRDDCRNNDDLLAEVREHEGRRQKYITEHHLADKIGVRKVR